MTYVKMPAKTSAQTSDGEPGAPSPVFAAEPAGAGETPLFDRSVLLEILGDEVELIEPVLDRYLGFVGSYVDLLAGALFSGDLLQVQLLSHAIKGAAINIGALQVAEVADRLEELAREGGLDPAVAHYDQLLAAVERLKRHLGLDPG